MEQDASHHEEFRTDPVVVEPCRPEYYSIKQVEREKDYISKKSLTLGMIL